MECHAKNLALIESNWTLRDGVSSLISNISCTEQSNFFVYFLTTKNCFYKFWSAKSKSVVVRVVGRIARAKNKYSKKKKTKVHLSNSQMMVMMTMMMITIIIIIVQPRQKANKAVQFL